MIAYDLDDTLASTDFSKVFGQTSLLGMIANAEVKYQPTGRYIIITARGENAAVQRATRKWVDDNLKGCQGVYFTTGHGETGMKNKLAVMNRHGVTEYVDTNKSNLKILSKLDPNLKLSTIEHHDKVSY